MLKKLLLSSLIIGVALFATPFAYANESLEAEECETPEINTVRIEVFERDTCGHCQDEKEFLNKLQKERGDLIILYHDIGEPSHKEHFIQLTELESLPKVTPITIIDGVILQGFDTEKTTGKKIRALVENAKGKMQN